MKPIKAILQPLKLKNAVNFFSLTGVIDVTITIEQFQGKLLLILVYSNINT